MKWVNGIGAVALQSVFVVLVTAICIAALLNRANAQVTIRHVTYVPEPIGIDYDPFHDRFIISRLESGTFYQFPRLNPPQNALLFSSGNNLGSEFYHKVLTQPFGPYAAGTIISPGQSGSGSILWAIDPVGNRTAVPVANPPSVSRYCRIGQGSDGTLYFANESAGSVYRLSWDTTSNRAVLTTIFSVPGSRPEGMVVLGANSRYGPWANKVVVLQNDSSTLYAIDTANGTYQTYALPISSLEAIYALPGAPLSTVTVYMTNYSNNRVISIDGVELAALGVQPGDLLIASEFYGLYHVYWDSNGMHVNLITNQIGHIEDVVAIRLRTDLNAFLTASPASIPADNQTTSTLTLTYRYSDGTPVVGRTIRFRSSRGAVDTFSSETAVTNAQGQASVAVRSGTVGVATFTCRDETAGVDLPASAQVNFTAVSQRRPVIDSITTSQQIQGPFLEDVSLDNTITVRVADWNGQPGRVEFRMPNGSVRLGQLSGNVATLTLDMGRDLLYLPNGRWNEVQITAYNAVGAASETRTVHFMGLSLPPSLWRLTWILSPVCNVSFTSNEVQVRFLVNWPLQGIRAAQRVPAPLPFMANTVWGHNAERFSVEITVTLRRVVYPQTEVQGTVEVRAGPEIERRYNRIGRRPRHFVGFTNFGWWLEGGLGGEFQVWPQFRLLHAQIYIEGGARVETTDILPVLAGSCCSWLAPLDPFINLFGRFILSASGSINLYDASNELTFGDSDLVLGFSGSLVLSIERRYRKKISGEIEAGIHPFIHLQFPGSDRNASYFGGIRFLHQVGVTGFVNARLYGHVWRSTWNFDLALLNGRFVYPAYRGGYLGVPLCLQDGLKGEWREPERNYLYREPYHQVVAGTQVFPQDDNWDVREERLIQNVFPSANPALTWKDGRAVILYVYDDPNLPPHQSTEIRALIQQPDGSWQDMPVTQDTALDSQPVLAVDANGNLVAVWTRMENVDPDPDPNLRLPKSEIAYAVYDAQTGAWSAPTMLTQDDRLDLNPQLVKGADGQLYLVWLKSPDNVFPTDFSRPSLPHTDIYLARWDGTAFVAVQRAIPRADTLEASLAVSSNGVPMLVWSRDADGNPDTNDSKLYYSFWDDSGWTTPQLVWSNPLPLSSPALAMGANDTPVLYFVRSELAHPEFENHVQEELLVTDFTGSGWREPLSITRADTLGELEVITHPERRVSAIWLAASQGVADLWTAVYDPAVGYWSNKVRLTQDEMTHEQQVFAAWDPAGNPSAVYIKRQLTLEEREVEDDEGNRYPIQVTVPARADLYLLSHRPKPDLTIREGDLTLEPSNPGPGQEVVIRARVSNLRALGARNVQVRFYDGDPGAGGVPIGTVQATPDPIVGGSFGTAELNWTVPTDGRSHVLYARVDPENAIAETDETNNTVSYPIALLDLEAVAPVVEQYLPDGRVALRFGVRNPSYVSPSGDVRWELRLNSTDGAIITQGVATAPAAGQTSELTFAWNPTLSAGRYTLYLVIDPDNRFAEGDETNNAASSEIALLADLTVNPAMTGLTRNGMQVTVEATVQNLGWVDAQNVVVQVLDAPMGLGNVLASGTVASLPRYGSASLSLGFTLPHRMSRVWVVVNPDGAVQEVRRDNNEVILNLPWQAGDVNGDGCVDDADLLMVMFDFGTRRLAEDVNRDGIVDDADLLAILFAFGQTGTRREDVNRDGIVDDADLLAILFAFGQISVESPADLNDDGTVDDADLLMVLFNFGSGC